MATIDKTTFENLTQEEQDCSIFLAGLKRRIGVTFTLTNLSPKELIPMYDRIQAAFEEMTDGIQAESSEELLPKILEHLELAKMLLEHQFRSTGIRIVKVSQEAIIKEQEHKKEKKAKAAKKENKKAYDDAQKRDKKENPVMVQLRKTVKGWYDDNEKEFDASEWHNASIEKLKAKIAEIYT